MANEQAAKRRKLEDGSVDTTPVKGVREESPEVVENGGLASMMTASPSPTRVSPSPNLTPRQPNGVGGAGDDGEALTRSRPPSLPPRDLSPVRVPYSLQATSRSNAPERASLDLPLQEP